MTYGCVAVIWYVCEPAERPFERHFAGENMVLLKNCSGPVTVEDDQKSVTFILTIQRRCRARMVSSCHFLPVMLY